MNDMRLARWCVIASRTPSHCPHIFLTNRRPTANAAAIHTSHQSPSLPAGPSLHPTLRVEPRTTHSGPRLSVVFRRSLLARRSHRPRTRTNEEAANGRGRRDRGTSKACGLVHTMEPYLTPKSTEEREREVTVDRARDNLCTGSGSTFPLPHSPSHFVN